MSFRGFVDAQAGLLTGSGDSETIARKPLLLADGSATTHFRRVPPQGLCTQRTGIDFSTGTHYQHAPNVHLNGLVCIGLRLGVPTLALTYCNDGVRSARSSRRPGEGHTGMHTQSAWVQVFSTICQPKCNCQRRHRDKFALMPPRS